MIDEIKAEKIADYTGIVRINFPVEYKWPILGFDT